MCNFVQFYGLITVFIILKWHILVFIFTVSLITAHKNKWYHQYLVLFFISYYIFTIYMSIFFVFSRFALHCYCFPSQITQSGLDIDSKTYFSFAAVYSALLWKEGDCCCAS